MRMLLSRATICAIALVVTVSLAGCDEDDGPESAPPSDSPSAPETSSPSEPTTTAVTETGPAEPTLPAGMAETNAGARDFVEFYWETVNYAQATGDADLLKSLSIESCAGCKAGIESIEKVYRRGGRILGGQFSLLEAVPRKTSSGAWNVSTDVRVGHRRVVDAGPLDETSRKGTVDFLFGLDFHDGAWTVTFLDVT